MFNDIFLFNYYFFIYKFESKYSNIVWLKRMTCEFFILSRRHDYHFPLFTTRWFIEYRELTNKIHQVP